MTLSASMLEWLGAIGVPLFAALIALLIGNAVWPFLLALVVRPVNSLRGASIGRRRAAFLVMQAIPESIGGNDSVVPSQPTATDVLRDELAFQERFYKARLGRQQTRLEAIDKRINNLGSRWETAFDEHKKRGPGALMVTCSNKMSMSSSQDMLFLWAIGLILVVDTMIASHVFRSLSLFVNDPLTFLGRTFYPFPEIYGCFITLLAALLIHFGIGAKRLEGWSQHKNSWVVVIGVLTIVFVLLLLSTEATGSASSFLEAVIRVCWFIGLFGVNWLFGKVLGPNEDYGRLVVAVALPLIFGVWATCGLGFVLGALGDKVASGVLELWYDARRIRAQRITDNEYARFESLTYGVVRGMMSRQAQPQARGPA